MAGKTIALVSLGCAKNAVDLQVMSGNLLKKGWSLSSDPDRADVVIVNTCSFIESAREEAEAEILRAVELKKRGNYGRVVVTGCYPQRYPELKGAFPGVDEWGGVPQDWIEPRMPALRFTGRAFAYLKIAEGCAHRCAYCAIPLIRGKYRSRPMEELIEEARFLEKQGVKELNIIAEDTSCYGVDLYGRLALPDLLRKLSAETDIPWFRIFYCYPEKITDDLVAEIRDNPRVLHYLDMPVQHINDDVLKRMNRRGGRALIESVIAKLRREIPDMVIRSTGIVGFPGETEEQFNEFLDFIADGAFDRFGAFAYSREENTPAAEMPDQIDEDVKLDRYEALMGAQAEVSFAAQQKCIGKTYDVLVEGFDDEQGLYTGRNYANGPDVDGLIFFSAGKELSSGDFVRVTIDEADDYDLYGTADV